MITMLLGGLWHGAGWTFVIWGGLHGLYLAVHKWFSEERGARELPKHPSTAAGWLRYLASAALTFHLVCLAWIFFRAPDLPTAWAYLSGIFTQPGPVPQAWLLLVLFYVPLALLVDVPAWWRNDEQPFPSGFPAYVRGVAYGCMLALCFWVGTGDAVPFIYFQF
jgi:D-alanyl-lipoteichoic acid acyltransferase DltB (MBOAT superfamily)